MIRPRAIAGGCSSTRAMRLADELGCPTLSVLAGSRLAGVSMVVQLDTFRDNLAWALPRAAAAGRTLTIELLNPDDAPRYLLTDPVRIRALLEAVGDPALRLQFDTYQFGRMVPDVAASFRELAPIVGHVQVGDVPDRHEPGTGAIEWAAFFAALADSGYDGSIGLRYEPSAGTFEGLRWIEAYGLERSNRPDGHVAAISPRPAATGWPTAWPAAPGRCTAGDRRRSCRDPGWRCPWTPSAEPRAAAAPSLLAPVADQDRERGHASRLERRPGLIGRRLALDDGRSCGIEDRDRRAGGQRAGRRAAVLDRDLGAARAGRGPHAPPVNARSSGEHAPPPAALRRRGRDRARGWGDGLVVVVAHAATRIASDTRSVPRRGAERVVHVRSPCSRR